VSGASAAGVLPSALAVARGLLADESTRGLFRGLGPRMASVSLWGTCMVNAYEALKRAAAR
jgi:solute carrier family 25 protein 44